LWPTWAFPVALISIVFAIAIALSDSTLIVRHLAVVLITSGSKYRSSTSDGLIIGG